MRRRGSGRRQDVEQVSRFRKRTVTETMWKTDWEHAKARERQYDSDITTTATLETWSHIHRLENVRENCEMWNPRFGRQRALDRGMVIGRYCLRVTLKQPASCILVVHEEAAPVAQGVYGTPQKLVERVCMSLHRGVYMHRVAQVEPDLRVVRGMWGTGC